MASTIRIGGGRWSIPPRLHNQFPVRAIFGDGVTLFEVRSRAWLPLDNDGFVDVTPGHSYLLHKLTQQDFIEKSTRMRARGIYYSQLRKAAKQQGRPILCKELAESWRNISKEELEKYMKLAANSMGKRQSEQEHAPTSAASSSPSVVSRAPITGQDGSTRWFHNPPKAASPAATESKPITDMLDAKKKKVLYEFSSTPMPVPSTTSTSVATSSKSQKPSKSRFKKDEVNRKLLFE